jgi:catechol 2,3-dioxygenase-like lactoylglutathione lyase family enzyme
MLALNDIAVVVKDAKASAAWWKDKLGFEIVSDEGHWVTVKPPGPCDVVLHLCANGEKESGNTGIGFTVEDVAKEAAALQKKGVKFTKPVEKAAWGTYAMFADPDGNEFWISEA